MLNHNKIKLEMFSHPCEGKTKELQRIK